MVMLLKIFATSLVLLTPEPHDAQSVAVYF